MHTVLNLCISCNVAPFKFGLKTHVGDAHKMHKCFDIAFSPLHAWLTELPFFGLQNGQGDVREQHNSLVTRFWGLPGSEMTGCH